MAGGIALNSSLFGATNGTPEWAATPTTPTAPMVTIDSPTWANVPTAKEIYWDKPGDLAKSAPDAEGLTGLGPQRCVGDIASLGATTLLFRNFDGGAALEIAEVVAVFGFDSTSDATRATSMMNTWYAECEAKLRANGATHAVVTTAPDPLDLGDAGDAVSPRSATYHSLLYVDESNAQDEGSFEDVVVAQLDDRIVWTVASFVGNENNCHWDPGSGAPVCHVIERLPAVAEVVVG